MSKAAKIIILISIMVIAAMAIHYFYKKKAASATQGGVTHPIETNASQRLAWLKTSNY